MCKIHWSSTEHCKVTKEQGKEPHQGKEQRRDSNVKEDK